jgi:hypothetical protein
VLPRALWSGGPGFAAQGSGRALVPVRRLVAPSLCPETPGPGLCPPPEIYRGGHGILPIGKTLRKKLRDGGECEEQEWAKEVIQAYWAHGIDRGRQRASAASTPYHTAGGGGHARASLLLGCLF